MDHLFSKYDLSLVFFFQAEDGIRCKLVTGVQTCALPIWNDRGELVFRQDFECSEKTEATPIVVHLPATLVSKDERKVKAVVFVYSGDGVFLRSEERRVGKECRRSALRSPSTKG